MTKTPIHSAFQVHMLNEEGKKKAHELAAKFNDLAQYCESLGKPSRELSITITKLEEACFFAKKVMASQKENQFGYEEELEEIPF